MNVTGVPVQEGFVVVAMDTLAGRFGFTCMVMALDITGFPVTQGRLEVIRQVMMSPFEGA